MGKEMKSSKKPGIEVEDFRLAMTGVQPLRPDNRLARQFPKPKPVPSQHHRDEASVLQELLQPVDDPAELETGEELLFLRPGFPQRLLRRLRRGYFSVSDSIDLHHLSEAMAHTVLLQFLADACRSGHGCVRIVHGKGLHSSNVPKLKRMTESVLRKFPAVIAFASCRPVHGGTGAVNVLLNKAKAVPR
jgi:DNA-nicking Smr family endonuclease